MIANTFEKINFTLIQVVNYVNNHEATKVWARPLEDARELLLEHQHKCPEQNFRRNKLIDNLRREIKELKKKEIKSQMSTRDIIRYIWELQQKYNRNKRFNFFQDLREAINKEIEEGEKEGIYYGALQNLVWLKNEITR